MDTFAWRLLIALGATALSIALALLSWIAWNLDSIRRSSRATPPAAQATPTPPAALDAPEVARALTWARQNGDRIADMGRLTVWRPAPKCTRVHLASIPVEWLAPRSRAPRDEDEFNPILPP